VCAAAAAPSASGAHPLHTTLTQITYDAKTRTIRAMIRVFRDDLGKAMAQKRRIVPVDSVAWGNAALAYAHTAFTMADAKGKALPLRSCGTARKADLVWLCLETPASTPPTSVSIGNQMLCDLFSDQVNIVQAIEKGTTRSALFTRGDGVKPLR